MNFVLEIRWGQQKIRGISFGAPKIPFRKSVGGTNKSFGKFVGVAQEFVWNVRHVNFSSAGAIICDENHPSTQTLPRTL